MDLIGEAGIIKFVSLTSFGSNGMYLRYFKGTLNLDFLKKVGRNYYSVNEIDSKNIKISNVLLFTCIISSLRFLLLHSTRPVNTKVR